MNSTFLAFPAALAATLLMTEYGVAQDATTKGLHLELNAINDTGNACRLSFVANNTTGSDIDQAVFETVIFDASGSVMSLSLFDFRDLPANRPRVRQFDVPSATCNGLGRVLINGANTCTVSDKNSDICSSSLNLSSRVALDLIG